jgi:hypothetical protein
VVEEPELLDDELEESELDELEAGFDSVLLDPSFFDALEDGAGPAPLPRA